jgi:hypothetical protein
VHPPEIEREIFRVPRDKVTADDVARSGCNYAPWYTRLFLAEGRVLARRQQAETLQAQELQELRATVAS